MLAAVRVVHSGVGGEAVRSGGEEGSSQRGVSLAPLHGVRSRRGVQEDAAGENAQLHTCMSTFRRSLDNEDHVHDCIFALYRREWRCTKSSPRTRTTSGPS